MALRTLWTCDLAAASSGHSSCCDSDVFRILVRQLACVSTRLAAFVPSLPIKRGKYRARMEASKILSHPHLSRLPYLALIITSHAGLALAFTLILRHMSSEALWTLDPSSTSKSSRDRPNRRDRPVPPLWSIWHKDKPQSQWATRDASVH